MNIKTKLVLATMAVALLAAPASARTDSDEGVASAYAYPNSHRIYSGGAASAFAFSPIVRPRATVQQRRALQRWR